MAGSVVVTATVLKLFCIKCNQSTLIKVFETVVEWDCPKCGKGNVAYINWSNVDDS